MAVESERMQNDLETPLRVAVVAACPFPCNRGTPARILGQANTLNRLGVQVEIISYHLSEFEPPKELKVHRTPRIPTYRRLRAGPSLQKLVLADPLLLLRTLQVARRRRPHLIHGHHFEGALIAWIVGRLLRIPVLFDAHTSLSQELPSYAPRLLKNMLRRLGARLDRFLVNRCDRVITVTESLRQEFAPHPRSKKMQVIPTPLEPQVLPDAPRAEPRSQSGPPVIIYAGSLAEFQRLDLLRKAFDHVVEQVPDAQIWIVSADSKAALAKTWPEALSNPNSIRFLQPASLEELFQLLRQADIAVSPRTAPGGLPQKIQNYMRIGLPIVASAGSGAGLVHLRSGWIVPNDDPEAFAAGIVELLRNDGLRSRMGRAAQEQAQDSFAWDSVGNAIVALYKSMLP